MCALPICKRTADGRSDRGADHRLVRLPGTEFFVYAGNTGLGHSHRRAGHYASFVTDQVVRGRVAVGTSLWNGGADEVGSAVFAAACGADCLDAARGGRDPRNTRNTRKRDFVLAFFPPVPRICCAML